MQETILLHFQTHAHGGKPIPKEPPLYEQISVLSSDSSTEHMGLFPIEKESPPSPLIQMSNEEDDSTVSGPVG